MNKNKLYAKNLKQKNLLLIHLLCIYKSSVPQVQACKLNFYENEFHLVN